MAHVITLQMSKNRVPRWLTEGISMFEEQRARPEWGRETEVAFAQALEAGKLLKLRDLNQGFSDPRLISLTYYQASLLVRHMIDTYGEPALHKLLYAYGRGLETDEALKEGLGVTIDQLQASFDARLEKDYAAVRRALKAPELPGTPSLDQLKLLAAGNPDSFKVQMELAQALHESGDRDGAIAALERAAKLVPAATGQENPNSLIALIALEKKDNARAIQALEQVIKVDSTDVEAARKLVSLIAPLGDEARTVRVQTHIAELDPFDVQAQAAVGR